LLETQSADGGWGYRPGAASATEPTAWALQALLATVGPESRFSIVDCRLPITDVRNSKLETRNSTSARAAPGTDEFRSSSFDFPLPQWAISQALSAGLRWLHDAQLPDGSWPAFVGQRQGCWVTAAVCLAVNACGNAGFQPATPDPVTLGLRRLCKSWPAEGSFWWRIRQAFGRHASVIRQDSSLRGWSWTPGTASWVEPTACALIAFRCIPEELHPRGASKRRQLAERMLYDRMCPGGGWHSGNALVYGVAGEPRVGPTAWALLALEDYRDRPENRKSLDWLEQVYPHIRGPASLALAHLCLEAYDRPLPPLEPALAELWSHNQFFHNVLATALAAMALSRSKL
jgi:hypothetical protein